MPYATDSGAQLDPYMDHLWKREHGAVVSTCMPLTREPNSILMRTTSERFDACLAVELEQGAFHEVLELDHVLEWLEGSELLWRGAPDDGGTQWPSVAISGHQWHSMAISMQSACNRRTWTPSTHVPFSNASRHVGTGCAQAL